MKKYHRVTDIAIHEGVLNLTIDGVKMRKELKNLSSSLAAASPMEQSEYEVSPSGYGIYWPRIDEDISIDGLLGIEHQPEIRRKIA